jgi:hypothetical protein
MLKNKNRLIVPGQTVATKEAIIQDDYLKKVYINALKYYADDKSANKSDILFSSMFMYSLGDKKLYEGYDKSEDNPIKIETDFFSKNLVSSIQFRLKDRKYILDSNVYQNKALSKFLNLNIHMEHRNNHELFSLIIENLKEKYIYSNDEGFSFLEHLNKKPVEDHSFNGLIDNSFDEKFNKEEKGHRHFQLDSYFKSELKTWQQKYETNSKVENLSSDIYPYVDTILYSNSEYFVVLVATELDTNYIDNKTQEVDKVFDCAFYIYNNKDQKMNAHNIIAFNEKLTFYIGKFINDCALNLLQENMAGSIGEAADISRYWYSDGYKKLFDLEHEKEWKKKNIFENKGNSLDFYTMLVETLLCEINTDKLKIKNTEIYPFDRVFLVPDSGLDENFLGVDNIVVLEAKMKSKDPFDRNGYIVGWEQDVEIDGKELIDEVDIVFSDKKVNKIKWNLVPSSEHNYQRKDTITESNEHLKSNLLLSTLLLSKEAIVNMRTKENEVQKKIYDGQKRTIRESFDDFGLHYSYEFGLDLKEVYPVLYELQDKYFKAMKEIDKTKDQDIYQPLKKDKVTGLEYMPSDYPHTYRAVSEAVLLDGIRKKFEDKKYKSKVVTICFDPERIIGKNTEFLGLKDRITMVFVADKDPVKTTSELKSEQEDLKVLMQMVIRQIIYNAELDKAIQEERQVLQTLLPQALHTVKGYVEDDEFKSKVDNLLVEYKVKFNRSLDTISNESKEYKGLDNFNHVLKDLIKYKDTSLQQLVENYKKSNVVDAQINDFDFQFYLNLSVLPDMEIIWDAVTVPEAFHVILKNAVQHSVMHGQTSKFSQVIVSMNIETYKKSDFLVISIVNNTTPISENRFNMLNDINSEGMSVNKEKSGSTGIGVALARKQLSLIHEANGINYTMVLKNMISVKMRLKINRLDSDSIFVEEKDDNGEDTKRTEITTSDKVDIVYFEDTPEYYTKTLDYLKTKNVTISHSKSIDISYMKKANLFLTDMSIFNDKGIVDELAGLDGIEQFVELNENSAPVCILSNALADDIRSKIMNHLNLDNDSNIVIVDNNIGVLEKGFIYIINNVKVLTAEHNMIVNYINSLETNNTFLSKEIINPFQIVEFLRDEKEYSQAFSEHFDSDTKEKFLLASVSVQKYDIKDTLTMWIDFKMSRLGTQSKKYTVSNVTYHKNTLLIIDDIDVEDAREKWWLTYLGMTHNIIFNFNNMRHDQILNSWNRVALKRESSGYLSKLRHDVKNYISLYDKSLQNTNLISLFENIMENTLKLQRIFKANRYESIKVYIDTDLNDNLSITNLFQQVDEVYVKMLEIENKLSEALVILTKKEADKVNIDNLTTFKELIALNIEFCNQTNGVNQ